MVRSEWLVDLARSQEIPPLTKLPRLSPETAPRFTQPGDRNAAQERLLHQRHYVQGKKEPSKGVKARIGLRSKAKIESINSTFTIQEQRDAFDELLLNHEPVGKAEAIIEFNLDHHFDVNVRAREARKGSKQDPRLNSRSTVRSRWLQIATEANLLDYVRLLVSRGPKQKSLDEALVIAVKQRSTSIATELLRHGAESNVCHDDLRKWIAEGDLYWATLLLSSPNDVD